MGLHGSDEQVEVVDELVFVEVHLHELGELEVGVMARAVELTLPPGVDDRAVRALPHVEKRFLPDVTDLRLRISAVGRTDVNAARSHRRSKLRRESPRGLLWLDSLLAVEDRPEGGRAQHA